MLLSPSVRSHPSIGLDADVALIKTEIKMRVYDVVGVGGPRSWSGRAGRCGQGGGGEGSACGGGTW